MEYPPILLPTLTFISDLFFCKGNIIYKTKTLAKCKTPCSLQVPCSTMITNIKNTDKIMEYVHKCWLFTVNNGKFKIQCGGWKNGTFPKDMAGCLLGPLQAGLVLRDFFLCDIALMRLANFTPLLKFTC